VSGSGGTSGAGSDAGPDVAGGGSGGVDAGPDISAGGTDAGPDTSMGGSDAGAVEGGQDASAGDAEPDTDNVEAAADVPVACPCVHGTCGEAGVCTNCDPGWEGVTCSRQGPVLYWKFDEATGTMAFDSTPNHFDGQWVGLTLPTRSTNVPPLVAATFSDPFSLLLNANDRQAVAYSPADVSALKPANDYTMSAWFRATTTDSSGSEVISMGDSYVLRLKKNSTTYQLQFSKTIQTGVTDAGVTTGFVNCLGPTVASPAFIDGAWHHVAATQSSTAGIALYLDGAQLTIPVDGGGTTTCVDAIAATNTVNTYYVSGRNFLVGRNGATNTSFDYDGNIDEVRVYGRVLASEEIQALAQGLLLPP